jgi:hypothetical protein
MAVSIWAKDILKNMHTRCPPNVSQGSADYGFLFALLRAHPRAESKIGAGVVHFYVRCKAHNEFPSFHILRTDGSVDDFSFSKCVDALGRSREEVKQREVRQNLVAAYRGSIWKSVYTFRDEHLQKAISLGGFCCPLCGKRTFSELLEVDHVVPFSTVVNQFEAQCGMPRPTEFVDCTGSRCTPYNKRFREEDSVYEQAWVEFHNDHSAMRVVCTVCHRQRTKSQQQQNLLQTIPAV